MYHTVGTIGNPKDGKAKIIAEGDGDKVKRLEEAVNMKNTLILTQVSGIGKGYPSAVGELSNFTSESEKAERMLYRIPLRFT